MARASNPRKLSAKHRKFVDEYLVDLNATQAAIRAGYAAKNADVNGPRLLGNAGIAQAVAKGREKATERAEITQDRVLAELGALAFSDHTHYAVDEKGNVELTAGAPANAHAAIKSIKRRFRTFTKDDGTSETTCEVEITLWDKPGTLKLAGRYKNVPGFFDKVEVTGKDGKDLMPSTKEDALAALEAVGIRDGKAAG